MGREDKLRPTGKGMTRAGQADLCDSDPMQVVLLAAGVLSLFPLGQLGTGLLLILLTLGSGVTPAH